jgi:hypothetical protein
MISASAFGHAGKVGGRLEAAGAGALDVGGADMLDVADAGVELADLARVDVDPQHLEPDLRIAQGQRQADIAEADDADDRAAVLELRDQVFQVASEEFVAHSDSP